MKYFTSDLFRLTNDVAAVEEDTIYVTSCLYFNVSSLAMMKNLLRWPLGSVVYYNGSNFENTIPQISGPNGILLSADQRYLYMNFPLLKRVGVWERKGDNSLAPVQTLNLRSAVDNLHLSSSGNGLFIGSHPITHKIMAHLEDPRTRAPSSVLYMPLTSGGKMTREEDVVELFYDHGDLITGSSVATVYDNKLLIGSVIDTLVICEMNDQPLPEGT